MDLAEVVAELEARKPEHVKPSLDRIQALTELLDHPERTYRTVHVTGTNGKTTTARLAARILCGQGVSAGLYTSPHLASVVERLAICDESVTDGEFVAAYEHVRPYLEEIDARGDRLSYFEALTGLGFLWMADKPVDVGVFEVGMGGTWDATNLVRGETAVITEIDVDHPELGATPAEIAGEKAGILKPGGTAIVARQLPEVMEVIDRRSDEVGIPVHLEGREIRLAGRTLAVGGQRLAVETPTATYDDLFVPLHGEHQGRHVALAIAATETILEHALHAEALRETLAGATSPGRLEVVGHEPLVVLDGAHNPAGARALAEAVGEAFVWRRLHLVLGVLADKDLEAMVDALAPRVDLAYACRSASPRARPPEEVARACERAGLPVTTHGSVAEAFDAARAAASEDDLVLVTGSLYTVADIRPRLVKD